jgi:hypothetical protein
MRIAIGISGAIIASALLVNAEPATAESYNSVESCESHYRDVSAQKKAVLDSQAWGSSSALFDEWAELDRESQRVSSDCSDMRRSKIRETVDEINNGHEKLTEEVLARTTKDDTVRAIQEKNLSTVRDQMATSATRLDETLWAFSSSSFDTPSSSKASSSVWNFNGPKSPQSHSSPLGQDAANSFLTGARAEKSEFEAAAQRIVEATRQQAALAQAEAVRAREEARLAELEYERLEAEEEREERAELRRENAERRRVMNLRNEQMADAQRQYEANSVHPDTLAFSQRIDAEHRAFLLRSEEERQRFEYYAAQGIFSSSGSSSGSSSKSTKKYPAEVCSAETARRIQC